MLSDEQIRKFQELYKKHFGEEISREKAYESGMQLINLIETICKTVAKDQHFVGKKP